MMSTLLPISVGIALGLMKHGAMMTVLSTLLTALAWPATLIAATDFIDSKWSIAIDRFAFCLWIIIGYASTCFVTYRMYVISKFHLPITLGSNVVFYSIP